jgi:signal peptidase II
MMAGMVSPAAPDQRAAPPARRGRLLAAMLVIAAVVVAGDQVSKALIVNWLPSHEPVRLLDGLITLQLTFNAGAAFSFGTSYTAIIALVAVGTVVIIIRTARRLRSRGWAVALGLLLGGTAGNLSDRLFRAPGPLRGRVVDWINLPHFPWTFNVADSSITCAAVLIAILAVSNIRLDGKPGDPPAAADA